MAAVATARPSWRCWSTESQAARNHAGTVADLLQRWFTAASPNWAVSTVRETRSLIRCHLDPYLG